MEKELRQRLQSMDEATTPGKVSQPEEVHESVDLATQNKNLVCLFGCLFVGCFSIFLAFCWNSITHLSGSFQLTIPFLLVNSNPLTT